ncbi:MULTISPECIES: hypothetical protein [unclassified Mesorhizobium]|uniref:hypothetical protein n=1 Tax=unclassified Mesorhizobium TaxID=325217 RepID=UPI001125BE8C|nr:MULTISPECIES: hypothetical protein [unclassified Mesorhizobium]TPK96235.1 hypothetical protein FJ567_21525 [Mesorhizobium sp. B2-4-16]TPL62272.1 hypothetical protein FJ956_25635 [Mesorhizobium sp. B2-4-3]
MKKFLFASVFALASTAAVVTSADAGNVFLGGSYFGYGPFGDFYDSYNYAPVYGSYWGGPYLDDGPGYGPAYSNDYEGGYVAPPSRYRVVKHGRHCRIETVRTRSHDHRFTREARVCS